jgi:AraC-like DNA-binding protein
MSKHRWRLRDEKPCEVVVMHFASLPPTMQQFISYDQPTCLRLSASDIAIIRGIHNEALPHYEHPDLECMVWFEKALTDYCILVAGKLMGSMAPAGFDNSSVKMQQALDWYRANLVHSPTIKDICAALNISTSRLRKIFKVTLKDTPGHSFQCLALDEACRIMAETSLSQKEIAFMCGFRGSDQFYRVFHQRFHISPSKWRENTYYGQQGFRHSRR